MKRLAPKQLGTLALAIRRDRIRLVWIALALLATFLILRFLFSVQVGKVAFLLVMAAFAVLVVMNTLKAWRTAVGLTLPLDFLRCYRAGLIASAAGWVFLFAAMAATALVPKEWIYGPNNSLEHTRGK